MTLYIKPINFIDSPQRYDGKTARLAGSMIWFAQVEIIERIGKDVKYHLVALDNWDEHISQYDNEQKQRLTKLYQNITTARSPIKIGMKNQGTQRVIPLDQPQVMGILNITPDSFSDGGKFTQSDDMDMAAVEAGYAMARCGAAIIDVGGESTRPGAKTLWEGDEIERILPAIERLAAGGTPISVDTRKAFVMEQGLAKGAAIINDISALGFDKRSIEVVRDFDSAIILMHAPSQGDNPHDKPFYDDVIFDVYDWLESCVANTVSNGVAHEKIMIDVGIGFGKSLSENLSLINNLSLFHAIGCPIVFGASRKRLIGALCGEDEASKRLGGSLCLAMKAIEQGVHIVRVHDVFETVQTIRTWRGLRDAALTAAV